MDTLLTTYAVAWAVVIAYVIRLAVVNTQLGRRLQRLESLAGHHRSSDEVPTQAA